MGAQLNKGITTEVQVVYLLVGIRKLIERDAQGAQYRTLNFYCDWVVHSKLDRSSIVKGILREFDKAHLLLKGEMNLPLELRNKIDDISQMRSFEKELTSFLGSYGLLPIAQDVDGWSHFLHLYTQVIQDIPLMVKPSSPGATQNISKLVVRFEAATETYKFGVREDLFYRIVREIFDKTGRSGTYTVHNSFDIARSYANL